MSLPVSLQSVVEEMDLPSDEWAAYIHRQTGQLVTITDDYVDPEVQALGVEESEDFLPLPSRFDIHEYEIMRDFCGSLSNENQADELASAIAGSGAFRRFKDAIRRHGIEDQWYTFRDEALATIASEFLDAHGIPYKRP